MMLQTHITALQWRRLVESIRRRNCILVLGPDAALDPDAPDESPISAAIAENLAATEVDPRAFVDRTRLQHVAQVIHDRTRDRIGLEQAVQDCYRPYEFSTTPFHEALATLPFRLCILTSPDQLLENAIRRAGIAVSTAYYDYHRAISSDIHDSAGQSRSLYYLFGSLADSQSLVLTESDLIEFMISVVRGTPPLAPFVGRLCSDESVSFLFLGFGFAEWHVRMLLRILRLQDSRRERSIALESTRFFGYSERPLAALFFQQRHAIEFTNSGWTSFAQELNQRFRAASSSIGYQMKGAPRVFLCYTSADQERVAQLTDTLHSRGIDTWRDKQNLRGGDDWRAVVEDVIVNQIDYFIVCSSRSLVDRVESWCFDEIKRAKLRNNTMRSGVRFIIPCMLERDAILRDIGVDHHWIHLASDMDVDRLVESIKQDWESNPRQPRVA